MSTRKRGALSLLEGPLDGLILPINPRNEGPPTHLAVHTSKSGWSCYEYEHGGGLAQYDVYRIAGEPVMSPTPQCQIFKLFYRGPLSQKEAIEIQRAIQQQIRSRERKRERDEGAEDDGSEPDAT